MVLRALELCAGYGGFSLGFKLAGVPVRTVAHVERDAYAAATLVARMEDQTLDQAPIWSDLTTFDGRAWRGRVDLITAGFPCQPFSAAGQRRGVDDDRWLWPAIGRIIRDVGPRFVFLENVPGLVRHGLPYVLADLASLGFDAEWGLLSASTVGAPHKRERFWLLAHASSGRDVADPTSLGRFQGDGPGTARQDGRSKPQASHGLVVNTESPQREGHRRTIGVPAELTGTHRPSHPAFPPTRDDHDGWAAYVSEGGPEPAVRRSADGPPPGLADALHAGGNGLVPVVAATAFLELAERLGVPVTSTTVACSIEGCPETDLAVGLDAHETWDGHELTFWCPTHCPECEAS